MSTPTGGRIPTIFAHGISIMPSMAADLGVAAVVAPVRAPALVQAAAVPDVARRTPGALPKGGAKRILYKTKFPTRIVTTYPGFIVQPG